MYFISDNDASVKNSDVVPKLEVLPISVVGSKSHIMQTPTLSSSINDGIKSLPKIITNENKNINKRVYGRARANLSFSSFYIFCEDFRKQLDYLYAHESETYRKNM